MKLALLLVTAWLLVVIVSLALDPLMARLSPGCQLAIIPAGLFVAVAVMGWIAERNDDSTN